MWSYFRVTKIKSVKCMYFHWRQQHRWNSTALRTWSLRLFYHGHINTFCYIPWLLSVSFYLRSKLSLALWTLIARQNKIYSEKSHTHPQTPQTQKTQLWIDWYLPNILPLPYSITWNWGHCFLRLKLSNCIYLCLPYMRKLSRVQGL